MYKSILDFLDEEISTLRCHQMLENLGVDYIIDTNMVRGLTTITTIFELITGIEQ